MAKGRNGGEGGEPTIRSPVCRISSAVLSTTQPPLRLRRDDALVSAGCLIAMKDGAGKRQIQVRSSFYLDSFHALTYARTRLGVDKAPCLFSCADALSGGARITGRKTILGGLSAQRLTRRRPPSGRAGTNMKG